MVLVVVVVVANIIVPRKAEAVVVVVAAVAASQIQSPGRLPEEWRLSVGGLHRMEGQSSYPEAEPDPDLELADISSPEDVESDLRRELLDDVGVINRSIIDSHYIPVVIIIIPPLVNIAY